MMSKLLSRLCVLIQ